MTLNRLRVCAGWSESLLVAHTTLLEISCRSSIIWVATCENLSCVGVRDQVGLYPTCSATKTSWNIQLLSVKLLYFLGANNKGDDQTVRMTAFSSPSLFAC